MLARVIHVPELVAALGAHDEVISEELDERPAVVARCAVFDDVDAHAPTMSRGCEVDDRVFCRTPNRVTPLRHGGCMTNHDASQPLVAVRRESPTSPLVISCDTCVARDTSACDDCIVPMLCGEPQHDAVIFDYEELRTLAVLAKSGLVPRLRHQRTA